MNMKTKNKIHYAGPVRTRTMKIIPGWAACCSGPQAEKIRKEGNNTINPDEVSCLACRKIMAKDKTIFNLNQEDPCAREYE